MIWIRTGIKTDLKVSGRNSKAKTRILWSKCSPCFQIIRATSGEHKRVSTPHKSQEEYCFISQTTVHTSRNPTLLWYFQCAFRVFLENFYILQFWSRVILHCSENKEQKMPYCCRGMWFSFSVHCSFCPLVFKSKTVCFLMQVLSSAWLKMFKWWRGKKKSALLAEQPQPTNSSVALDN